MKILVLNGPNLQLLGIREPEIYGRQTYDDLVRVCIEEGKAVGAEIEVRQSNHEGDLVDWIGGAYGSVDGIVLNPAAYTHTSVALLDAVKGVGIPTVEVHLSDVSKREAFRQVSYVREACIATISGHGADGYREAIRLLAEKLKT